jgi:hypothetical protein
MKRVDDAPDHSCRLPATRCSTQAIPTMLRVKMASNDQFSTASEILGCPIRDDDRMITESRQESGKR